MRFFSKRHCEPIRRARTIICRNCGTKFYASSVPAPCVNCGSLVEKPFFYPDQIAPRVLPDTEAGQATVVVTGIFDEEGVKMVPLEARPIGRALDPEQAKKIVTPADLT
jgi:hypothetical protein